MDESESLSHAKWECKYHVVFIPKCRRRTLYEQLRRHLGEVFRTVHAASESVDPNIRARYFINRGDTFSRIKRTLGRWLLHGLDALDNVASVFSELIKNLVQIKPNRSYPRNFTKKPHESHAYKHGV